jgi:dihydrofolate synthase/folylpolyglutamate synthase
MTYQESLNYINSLLRFGMKPGLERIKKLCDLLGNPQDRLKFIHIAGTNGKGSTCAYLSKIFSDAGYKTGMFTSPYVTDFRERFQICGAMIEKEKLCRYTEVVKSAAEKMAEMPTEFEFITALAFLYFAQERCDIVILEVGLGGRFDSTNIIKAPLCSVITSIGLDHIAVLGNTVEKIAFEKAGIIKKGCPVVVSACVGKSAFEVIKSAAIKRGSELFVAKSDFPAPLKIRGNMQKYNAAASFLAAKISDRNLADENIIKSISEVQLAARCEFLSPDLLLDGGHNADAVDVLCDCIKKNFTRPTALIGMMADKDTEYAIKQIAPLCKKIYAVRVNNPRSESPENIAKIARNYCSDIREYEDINKAVADFKAEPGQKVVCGSFYLAGEIREMLI